MYFPMNATFVGYVGQDAEMRTVETRDGEVTVANFSIGISVGRGDDRQTQWVRVELWRKYAEAVGRMVKKGMKVTVETRQAKLDAYEDKNGEPQAALVVVADTLHLPQRDRDGDASVGHASRRDPQDIPF
jgi:single stranded DNA-binding protein